MYFWQVICLEVDLITKKRLAKVPEIPSCETELTVIKTNVQTGEIIFEKTVRGSRCGSGWLMMFTDMGMEIVEKCPSPTTLRVFLYLAMGQNFAGGLVTTKLSVEQKLGISHKACADAFKWLKSNFIIHEWRNRGCTEFMVNPRYVSVGKLDERIKLWNSRWNAMPFYANRQRQKRKSQEFEQVKVGVSDVASS